MTVHQSRPQPQPQPQRKLKVGVVGIGRIGQQHALNVLRLTPRADLLCVCSPAPHELAWADEHLAPHGVKAFPTFEEMLEMPGLEAVIIASLTKLHQSQTMAALDKGIHVLCEKPICSSLEELETLCRKAESRPETKVMVGFCRRFDESYRSALAKVRSGTIGRPFIFRSHGSEVTDDGPFFKQYLRDSGGIYIDTGVHDIDLALMFLDEGARGGSAAGKGGDRTLGTGDGSDDDDDALVVPKSVSAVGTAVRHKELAETGDADNAIGVVEFWGGRVAHFWHSRTSAHGYDNQSEVVGTAGKLSVNLVPRRDRVEICGADGYVKVEPTPTWYERYEAAFPTEVRDWVAAVLDGREVPVSLGTALRSLTIATALQESLRTGRKIEFTRGGVPVGIGEEQR